MRAADARTYWKLQILAHLMQKHADRLLGSQVPVTTAQTGVLASVKRHGPVRQGAVAEALGLNLSAVTPLVTKLEAGGYITRKTCPDDGRARLLSLTAKGEKLLDEIEWPFDAINAKIERHLGSQQISELDRMIEALIAEFRSGDD